MAMRGRNMHLAFGLETIFDDAEFTVGDRDKVGIVGVNGAGKTTLFKVLLGKQELDSGDISSSHAGGIAGWCYSIATFTDCTNSGNVSSSSDSSADSSAYYQYSCHLIFPSLN